MKTNAIFSFDTEDFTNPYAADAILREAKIMSEEGIRGGFCTVGLLTKSLKEWGREDVIEAMSQHDILCHSYRHSVHPTINEYTDVDDYEEAHAEFIRQESEALRLLRETFPENEILGACPPGNQKSYVAQYGYADLGLPLYVDGVRLSQTGEDLFFCNSFQPRYSFCLEQFFSKDHTDDRMQEYVDTLAHLNRAIIYTHPNSAVYTTTWDTVNYKRNNKVEFGKWNEPPRRTIEETEHFYENIRRFIKILKSDGRFNITSYSELAERVKAEKPRVIHRNDLSEIKEALKANVLHVIKPSLCISDVFLACVDFLRGEETHNCGKVYGFLYRPFSQRFDTTLTKDEMIQSAKEMNVDKFLPSVINVNDKLLGPADWLFAALDILTGAEETVSISKPQLPNLDRFPELKNVSLKGEWLQSETFEDKFISDRLKWQSWTIRYYNK